MSKSRLWTLAMALAASMGRPASAHQLRQLESEIRELAAQPGAGPAADPSSSAGRDPTLAKGSPAAE